MGQSLLWLQEGKVRQGTQAGLPHLNHFSGFWGVEAGLVVWPLTLERLRQGREVKRDSRGLSRGAAGNLRFPRLLPGTLGNFPGCL